MTSGETKRKVKSVAHEELCDERIQFALLMHQESFNEKVCSFFQAAICSQEPNLLSVNNFDVQKYKISVCSAFL